MNEKINQSPLPEQVMPQKKTIKVNEINELGEPITIGEVVSKKEMDFPDAIREVIAGKKIHRLEWSDKEYYGFLNGDILSLHKPDGNNYKWIVNEGDLIAEDWIII